MKIINRRAKREYQITDEIEAGIVLSGAEVKSLRQGRGRLSEAFARLRNREVWLFNFMIPAYKHADTANYNPSRPRKLLLNKREILALGHKIEGKNLTLVPLVCYTTGRFVKVKLGVGKGKKQYEKREAKRRRDLEREVARTLRGKR